MLLILRMEKAVTQGDREPSLLRAEGGEPNDFLTPSERLLYLSTMNSHNVRRPYLNDSGRTHFKTDRVLLAVDLF